MSKLGIIADVCQEIAEAIALALEVDVEIVDTQLVRFGVTGKYKKFIGKPLFSDGTAYKYAMKEKVSNIIIKDPGSNSICKNCIYFNRCPYKIAAYAPIEFDGEMVGVISLVAFDEDKKEKLLYNLEGKMQFVIKMAGLLSSKIKEKQMHEQIKELAIQIVHYKENKEYFDKNNYNVNITKTITIDEIIGESLIIKDFKEKILKVASSDSTVLLIGETGTGKELFAKALHYQSNRKEKPFVVVNCGALPESLIESELFGYEKGAFTGANKTGKLGKFEIADSGTIFLDEIQSLPLFLQPKLLRVIQEREIEKLGGMEPIKVDVRILASTNTNLEEMVNKGLFRHDLFHRLNVVPLEIPPLRDRGTDILLIADHFLRKNAKELNKDFIGFSEEVESFFLTYHWPGNVRELQNTVEFAANFETSNIINKNNLPQHLQYQMNKSAIPSLEFSERKAILKALETYGWTNKGIQKAASFLGISRSTIYRKIKKYNLRVSK